MLTFILLLASNIDLMRVLSAPVGHGSNLEIVHWVSPPPTRGTFNILTSCVLTLILCMWTALHLNVPPQNEGPIGRTAHKLKWTLIALLAPEIVAYIAWRQWLSARTLAKAINDIIDKQDGCSVPQSPKNRRWTTVHGFYAGMGGFAFKTEKSFIRDYPSPLQVPLTAKGVLFLANQGHIEEIRISEESIIDKSKADSLAKTLLCIQAGWFILQSITRLATNLPITLLEVNTVGHALCALAIYGLWFQKPLEVRNPHTISSDWVPPLCAYMWMTSTASERLWNNERKVGWETDYLIYSEGDLLNVEERADAPDEESVELAKWETLKGTCFKINDVFPPPKVSRYLAQWHMLKQKFGYQQLAVSDSRTVALCREDIWRWRLASQAIKKNPEYLSFSSDQEPAGTVGKRSVGNDDTESLVQGGVSDTTVGLVFAFVSGAYGGLHASKWNDFFPSWPECLLWKISSLVVVAVGGAVSIWIASHKALGSCYGYIRSRCNSRTTVRHYNKLLTAVQTNRVMKSSKDLLAAIQTNKVVEASMDLIEERMLPFCRICVIGTLTIGYALLIIGYVFCRAYLVAEDQGASC